ncbi:MAG: LacI family transcriptional regulator [Anaerolineae bacterium]|jgi:DNA-binding LacI/PurR family transcriptional regulator|nr:LacI family transcriptional regulator [Anaerolineae bacterium]
MSQQNPVTQEDVARRAGVSRAVVSYVLNNGPRKVSEETRRRVLQAINELEYRPNEFAQRLKQGSEAAQNTIGIVTGGNGFNLLARPYYNVILSGLYDHAYQQGQQIGFLAYWEALKDPIFFNKHIHEQEISSLILILPSLIPDEPQDRQLFEQMVARIPNLVCLEESVNGLPTVMFDRAEAARIAMSHLIGLGHQRIVFIGINDQRVTGHHQALMMHQLPYDESLVHFLNPAVLPAQSAYDIIAQKLRAGDNFTAIFTATDEAAIGAIAAVKDYGLRVPEDIAVASIDNLELSEMVRPALTTVDIPKQALARHAIQSIMTRTAFPDQNHVSVVLPTKLIVRDSCGTKLVKG